MRTVLLTGATGYIGSHTWLSLLADGWRVVGLDDFSNSSPRVLERLQAITGQAPVFERADVRDAAALERVFDRHAPEAVVHFAARKAVGESVARPLECDANNVRGLLTVIGAMNLGAGRGDSVPEVLRAFEGTAHSSRGRAAPSRRCRRLLCRPDARRRPARLANPPRPGPDVRRQLALAADESDGFREPVRRVGLMAASPTVDPGQ